MCSIIILVKKKNINERTQDEAVLALYVIRQFVAQYVDFCLACNIKAISDDKMLRIM